MSRLGKKCFFASTALHLLLTGVLLVGVAFHTRENPVSKMPPPMTIVKVTDAPTQMKGGSPEPKPPEAPAAKPPEAPPAVAKAEPVEKVAAKPPVVAQEKKVETPKVEKLPMPVHSEAKPPQDKPKPTHTKLPPPTHSALRKDLPTDEPTKPVKTKPKDVEAPTSPKGLQDDDLKPVHHTTTSITKPAQPKSTRPSQEEVAQYAAAQEAYAQAKATAQIVRELSSGIGASTASPIIKFNSTPGSGGDSQAETNYRDLVFNKYNSAWDPSADMDDVKSSVIACIRIAPDGRVISREITQKSGNRLMDRSIQSVLDRVNFIEPFPAGSDNQPRTYFLRFNLQTKRSFG